MRVSSRPAADAKSLRQTDQPCLIGGSDGAGLQRATPSMGRFEWAMLLLCFTALALRVIHLLQTAAVPTSHSLSGDALAYFEWAKRIAAGDWMGDQPFYQAPLYPYVLALLIKAFAADVVGVHFAQALVGATSVAFIGLAGRWMFSPAIGLVSASILAVYPPAIYYDGIIQKTCLDSVILCVVNILITIVRIQFG